MEERIRLRPEDSLSIVAGLLRRGYEVEFLYQGDRMLPFIRGGKDYVRVRSCESVGAGDIVFVRLPEGDAYGVFRVMDLNQNRLLLVGDGELNNELRSDCTLNNVKGKVVRVIRPRGSFPVGEGFVWRLLLPVRGFLMAMFRGLNIDRK